MFVGRKDEIARLIQAFQSPNQENIVLYGRRRIGKSELIKHVLDQARIPYLYYQAKETSERDNVESLSRLLGEQFALGKALFPSMESIVEYLFEQSTTPFVLVIDEYPYLQSNSEGLDSVLQRLIDQMSSSKLKIVLLGSFIDVMKSITDSHRPLYGRITLSLFLSELNYQEASAFYPESNDEEKLAYYSVFGGVPYYNQWIDCNQSFMDNVCKLIIDDRGILSDFIELFLSKELRKLQNANAVLETIAIGKRKFGDILGKLQGTLSSPQLAIVLDSLIRMDLIAKTTPINEPATSKKTYYEIKDNFVRFYYRYVFRNLSKRSVLNPSDFYLLLVKEDLFTQTIPHIFEQVAKQYLLLQNKQGAIRPPYVNIGKLWYDDKETKTNGEFDVVAESVEGYVVYEVKYTDSLVTDAVVAEEAAQLDACHVQYHKLGFFSKSGFRLSQPEKYVLKTLADVYRQGGK